MAGQPSNNPWKTHLFEWLRNVFRLAIWFVFVLNVLMLAVFVVVWVAHFLWHLWAWFDRVWFSEAW